MSRVPRVNPLYVLTAVLAALAVLVAILTGGTSEQAGAGRSASVFDDGPGGAGTLRRYLTAMGGATTTIQGDAFAIDRARVSVLFILGASEVFTRQDISAIRSFVASGGTVVVATDLGFFERPILEAYDMRALGIAREGTYSVATATLADPPTRSLAVDRGRELALGPHPLPLVSDGAAPVVAVSREGAGLLFAVASVGPFLRANLADADNARFALALAAPAFRGGGAIAFDEYHHGVHPSSDVLVLLERTWPGRALVYVTAMIFVFLLLTGRRLGPPLPLDPRPPRSSLEYVRGFAGLVRRSGRGEIARRRLRADLHRDLARSVGLDPDTPLERTLQIVGASDAVRAESARSIDLKLQRRLREAELLRTVRDIEGLTGRANEQHA